MISTESSKPDLDDVWASSDDEVILSETIKVRRAHYNDGYIEGISESKDQYLQQGFDEGYPLGAEIGLEVGRILGAFQGLGLTDLERAAVHELSPDYIFSEKYYTANGVPKWEGVHPLVAQWSKTLEPFLK